MQARNGQQKRPTAPNVLHFDFMGVVQAERCGPRRRLLEQNLHDQVTSPTPTTPLLEGSDDDPAVSDISSTFITMRQGSLPTSHEAFRRAAEGLDGRGRLLMLQEMHRALGRNLNLKYIAELAVEHDDVACFLYACNNGALFYEYPMVFAAAHGALSILEYGFEHKDGILWKSFYPYRRGSTREQALKAAAGHGHLACVRFLHKRGVRMWNYVEITDDYWFGALGLAKRWVFARVYGLVLPDSRQVVESLWGVLRYGELHGVSLPESAKCIIKERQGLARAVLACFCCAARLSPTGGEHGRLWGVVARVPTDVVYNVLVAAELEIEEAFTRGAAHVGVGSRG